MTSIFRFFVENWRFSVLLTAFLLLIGVLGSTMLQREAFPPVNFARVTVNTVYPGASPQEVNDKVTQVVEDELRGVDGIKEVRSTSRSERSEIDIRIDIDRFNPDQVVNEIQRAVQRASSKLPPELPEDPVVFEEKANEIPILEFALVGRPQDKARDRWAEDLKEKIEDVKGVAAVRFEGYRPRELQILLDQEKLTKSAVTLAEVMTALQAQLKDVPAGYLTDKKTVNLVRLIGQTRDPQSIENLIVRSSDSYHTIRIGDIGRVVDGSKEPTELVRMDGEEATILVLTKMGTSDALDVLEQVREEISKFEKTLPAELKIKTFNDEGQRIEERLRIVTFNAAAGLIIVLLVLFVFLPGKIGVASALSLPVCALATILGMVFLGANFNIITMVALIICLGNLVDNSVVVSEHYAFLREQGLKAQEAAIRAARQFWVPFTASTITIISGFFPMIVTQGVMGQFIRWIPIVVTIALTLSLIESLTLLPARLQFIHPKPRKAEEKNQDWFSKVEARFATWVDWTLKKKWITLGALSGLVVSGFVVTATLNRFELFPAEGVEYYVVRYDAPPGTSLYQTDALGQKLADQVRDLFPAEQIKAIKVTSGQQSMGPGDNQAKFAENAGLILVAIPSDWAQKMNSNAVLEKLRTITPPDGLDRVSYETIQNGPPVGKPLTVTFRSNEEQKLLSAIAFFKKEIAPIPGVMNLQDDAEPTGPEQQVRLKTDMSSFAGINVDLAGLNLRTAFEGTKITEFTEKGLRYDVVVRFDDQDRRSLQDLQNVEIVNPSGRLIQLNKVASIEEKEAPRIKKNFEFINSVTVTADVDPSKITSIRLNQQARDLVAKHPDVFSDVKVQFGGEEESTNESLQSLVLALIMAIFGIFATLVFTFKSFSRPFLILSTIPLGLVGVTYAFVVDQRPLSFLAFIGIVGLSGVVINSAIILVDAIDELRQRHPDWSLHQLLVTASSRRLRAVLATGLTTVVGLLPTAFGFGGYDPLLVPMTLALSWGMMVGTLLSLFWIPCGYYLIEQLKSRLSRLEKPILS